MKKQLLIMMALLLVLVGCQPNENKDIDKKDMGVVNVYTTRHYDADDAIYARFTEETGIKVNVVTDEAVVSVEKIKEQGQAVQADVFMTSDAGNLAKAKEAGILDAIESQTLTSNVPSKYRDQDNMWFGLTKRARVFLYSTERLSLTDLEGVTYENLVTDPRFTDKVLIRTSSNIYNQSLVASFIEIMGSEKTEEWITNLVSSMARNPEGNDRVQAVEVKNGTGDIAIANSYYYGKLVDESDTESKYYGVADVVGIYFPNQGENESGVHINVSGAGVVKHAKNKDNAIKLIEFLSEVKQQEEFAATNYEFPVNVEASYSELTQSWLDAQGIETLKEQDINLNVLGDNNNEAYEMMIKLNWDTPKQ